MVTGMKNIVKSKFVGKDGILVTSRGAGESLNLYPSPFYFLTITLPLPWCVARISTSAICTCAGALAA